MSLKIVKYEKKYLKRCAELVRRTWNLHGYFKKLKRRELVYIYYLLTCENYSEHREILIDDNDDVRGVLFGSIEDEPFHLSVKYRLKKLKLQVWAWFHLVRGNFGDKEQALIAWRELVEADTLGEQYAEEFDSEINLLIVDRKYRGKGYGRKLMDSYMRFCMEHELETAFLWTDLDCRYNFYEKYGFKLYETFYHETLSDRKNDRDNGMIYYIDVETVSLPEPVQLTE